MGAGGLGSFSGRESYNSMMEHRIMLCISLLSVQCFGFFANKQKKQCVWMPIYFLHSLCYHNDKYLHLGGTSAYCISYREELE